jgi:hypothetical protein
MQITEILPRIEFEFQPKPVRRARVVGYVEKKLVYVNSNLLWVDSAENPYCPASVERSHKKGRILTKFL